MITYTVWVGGSEVNPYYLNKDDAERISKVWRSMGYEDVVVEEITNE